MKHWLIVVALALAGMFGCGSDDDMVAARCVEMWSEGAVIPDDADEVPCTDEDGDLWYTGIASYDCDDGGEVHYHDRGWWKSTDNVFHEGGTTGDDFTIESIAEWCGD